MTEKELLLSEKDAAILAKDALVASIQDKLNVCVAEHSRLQVRHGELMAALVEENILLKRDQQQVCFNQIDVGD